MSEQEDLLLQLIPDMRYVEMENGLTLCPRTETTVIRFLEMDAATVEQRRLGGLAVEGQQQLLIFAWIYEETARCTIQAPLFVTMEILFQAMAEVGPA